MIQKIKAFLEKFFVKESCILIGTEILETHGLPLWASFGGTPPFNQKMTNSLLIRIPHQIFTSSL